MFPKWTNGYGGSPTHALPRSSQTSFLHQSGARGESPRLPKTPEPWLLLLELLRALTAGDRGHVRRCPLQPAIRASSSRAAQTRVARTPCAGGERARRGVTRDRLERARPHLRPRPPSRAPAASRRGPRASPAVAALRSFQSEVHARGPREGQQHFGNVELGRHGGAHCL